MTKQRIIFLLKLAISLGIVIALYSKVIARQGAADLWHHLSNISFGWVLFGLVMQLCAISCSVIRWQRLLIGQGIHAPLRHLIGSFMIGRFFGEFAPGGWTGLNGYRIYDIAKHTGKVARATASIGIEMVLGWLAFGAVVIGGSFFGLRFIGVSGVLLVDAFFLSLIVASITLVSKPALFRLLAARMPAQIAGKLRTTTDAVCAYEGKGGLVAQAALLGIGTHFFRAFIYVGAAHALNAQLGVGEVFFGSSLQIFATLLPASINGIGLREATAVALYTRVGVPDAVAVLIPTLGFLIEMFISSFGGIVFMARRVGYSVQIQVEHAEHEEAVHAALPPVPESEWPKRTRGLAVGLGAGLLAGALLGCGEAIVILRSSAADPDYGVLVYGTLVYALIFGGLGAGLGLALAWSGRLMQRTAAPESRAYARTCAAFVAAVSFAIGAFRVRRDYYHEELVWKSAKGLAVLGGCALAAVLVYFVLSFVLRLFTERRPGGFLLKAWGTPALIVALGLGLFGFARVAHHASAEPDLSARPKAPPEAGNILFIVVDTLRADHLPLYGYQNGKTPRLDAFAKDAIRFDAAFANASWTRPSFASILSGRYPASHRTMAKGDALPNEIATLPEALRSFGYTTRGIVTNYNVAPFFNFHQGFDVYRYLEPNFVLGANDTAAKLLLVQFMRQRIETVRAKSGRVEVGSAYQDASVVNKQLLGMLDQQPKAPWFFFVGYMDPHDPYYPHPYDGTAYARAAHQEPDPDEAPALRKLYDGEITYWDENFGQLIDELKRRNIYDELTIVITADHGEEFHEHGGFWHGTTLYDEQVRVPLLVKLPGGEMRGNVVRHWVQSIDLMPTLLKRAGVAIPQGVQGRELFAGNTEVFAEESHEGNVLRALRIDRGGAQLKLITANPGNPRKLAEREFYRVDQDPREQVNLAADEPALVEFSHKALEQHERDAAQGRASQQSVDIASDENAAARLRALGYAGGDKPN
ncbi:MAG TPA: sulfatase-like hydrolase/transferase [Polyangiales bacterium]|nr:sulfatase-like hydrolase/transferase [Polyangiales bacterium]